VTKPPVPPPPVPPDPPPPIGDDLERLRGIVTFGPHEISKRDVAALSRLLDHCRQVARERDEAKRECHRLKEAMDPDPFPTGGKGK
jgi:hypothetical protein